LLHFHTNLSVETPAGTQSHPLTGTWGRSNRTHRTWSILITGNISLYSSNYIMIFLLNYDYQKLQRKRMYYFQLRWIFLLLDENIHVEKVPHYLELWRKRGVKVIYNIGSNSLL
jgi:hypothetical protein